MAAGVAQINYYATAGQSDALGEMLTKPPLMSRAYGATGWRVQRSTDDRHKYLVQLDFDDKKAFTKFWYGPEMQNFRARTSGMHQMALAYEWYEKVLVGPDDLSPEEAANAPILGASGTEGGDGAESAAPAAA